jgi:hypothetical protein
MPGPDGFSSGEPSSRVPCEPPNWVIGSPPLLGPYIGAFLFGGLLLALSLFAGGHDDAAGDAHGHGDHDGHGHAEADADGDAEAHADSDAHGHDSGAHASAGEGSALLSTFASLRFWTFFFAFAGGTGIALTLAGLPTVVTAVASGMMGAVSGGFAAWAFRYLGRNQLSSSLSSEDWIGRTARVVVPVSDLRPGKILMSFDNEVKELVALSAGASDGAIGIGEEVIVVSMIDGVAKVTRNRPDARPIAAPQTVKSS